MNPSSRAILKSDVLTNVPTRTITAAFEVVKEPVPGNSRLLNRRPTIILDVKTRETVPSSSRSKFLNSQLVAQLFFADLKFPQEIFSWRNGNCMLTCVIRFVQESNRIKDQLWIR
jgi:hypothetical protein